MKLLWILCVGLFYIVHQSSAAPGAGGLSASKPGDDEARSLVNKVRKDVVAKRCAFLGINPDSPSCEPAPSNIFDVLSYKTDGTNYIIKIRGNLLGKIWHVKVHQPEGGKTPELAGIVGPKQLEDEIENL